MSNLGKARVNDLHGDIVNSDALPIQQVLIEDYFDLQSLENL